MTNVRAVLSWSYDQLSEPAARMFRLLGVHPGPDISLSAAASLAAMPRSEAGAVLRELARTHMVAEHLPARFTFHNLLRVYAAETAERHDPESERRAAAARVLDHYLHTAMTASSRFSPGRSPLQLTGPQPGVLPGRRGRPGPGDGLVRRRGPGPARADQLRGRAWFRRARLADPVDARPVLHPARPVAELRSHPADRAGRGHRLGEPLALAHAHYLLGHAHAEMGDYETASANVRRALDLFRGLGDRGNEANVLNGLANMLQKQERLPEALAVALDALRMLKAVGHWWTQATLENGVGWLYAHLGQYDQALTHCQRALSLHRESGHRGGAADTLDSLAFVYLRLGDTAQAKAHYTRAVEAYRDITSPFGEGNSLTGLGDALLAEGDRRGAAAAWREAVAILDRLPHPLANDVRARLRDLGDEHEGDEHDGDEPDGDDGRRRRRRAPGRRPRRPGPADRGGHGGPLGIKEGGLRG